MNIYKDVFEFIFIVAILLNTIFFILKILYIKKEKSESDLSLTTFLGFLAIQLTIALLAMLSQKSILMWAYILNLTACAAIVLLTLRYKKKQAPQSKKITAEDIIEQLPGHVDWKARNKRRETHERTNLHEQTQTCI